MVNHSIKVHLLSIFIIKTNPVHTVPKWKSLSCMLTRVKISRVQYIKEIAFFLTGTSIKLKQDYSQYIYIYMMIMMTTQYILAFSIWTHASNGSWSAEKLMFLNLSIRSSAIEFLHAGAMVSWSGQLISWAQPWPVQINRVWKILCTY